MKKVIVCALLLSLVVFNSCYTYTSVVGEGAKGTQKEKRWNHYLLCGLIPVGPSDSKAMAGGAKDYTVTTKHTFVNHLVGFVTLGIYTPTTTTVRK